MALAATMVFEVRNGGSDSQCSGGFNAARGGTDYTLQTSAQATGTVTSATTTVTATTGIFTSVMVGNTITDGTTTKEITAFTSATQVTVDSAPSWTGATIYVGGALASPGKASALATVAGMITYVKYNATPYGITSATTNVAAGCLAPAASTSIFGYNTTRTAYNTDALQPTLQLQSVSAATILGTTGFLAANLILDGNNQTTSRGLGSGTAMVAASVFKNFTNGGTGGAGTVVNCLFTGCSAVTTCSCNAYGCVATANSVAGFAAPFAVDCISYANTGATTDGYIVSGGILINCVSFGNGRDGFRASGTASYEWVNLVAEGNGGFGYNSSTGASHVTLINGASFNNTSGRLNTGTVPSFDIGAITGSASFFTNAAGGVFTPNATSGAGALLRAAAYPQTFPAGLTTSASDVGASQHPDPTVTYPATADVRSGTVYGGGTGTLTVPAANKVLTPTAVDNTTGTLTIPTASQVISGVTFGIAGTGTTGNVTEPAVTDVRSGVQYGASGTQFTGTLVSSADYPAPANVLLGVAYDFGALVGTYNAFQPNPQVNLDFSQDWLLIDNPTAVSYYPYVSQGTFTAPFAVPNVAQEQVNQRDRDNDPALLNLDACAFTIWKAKAPTGYSPQIMDQLIDSHGLTWTVRTIRRCDFSGGSYQRFRLVAERVTYNNASTLTQKRLTNTQDAGGRPTYTTYTTVVANLPCFLRTLTLTATDAAGRRTAPITYELTPSAPLDWAATDVITIAGVDYTILSSEPQTKFEMPPRLLLEKLR